MYNVLILPLSTYGGRGGEFENKSGIKTPYYYAMDPIILKLADEGININRVILLETNEVQNNSISINSKDYQSVSEYFEEFIVSKLKLDSKDVIHILINEDNSVEAINNTVVDIRSSIKDNPSVQLFIDDHGSFRGISVALLSIISLLNCEENIKKINIYTFRFGANKLVQYGSDNIKNPYTLNSFVSGINEFINYGRIDSLINYYENEYVGTKSLLKEWENLVDDYALVKDNKTLLDCIDLTTWRDKISNTSKDYKCIIAMLVTMKHISNSIQLCDMDGFEKELDYLNVNKENDFTGDSYLSIFSDLIFNDYGKLLNSEERTPLSIIEWCTKKSFIQQALTVLEDKMPKMLINYFGDNDAGIIRILPPTDLSVTKDEIDTAIHKDGNWYESTQSILLYKTMINHNKNTIDQYIIESILSNLAEDKIQIIANEHITIDSAPKDITNICEIISNDLSPSELNSGSDVKDLGNELLTKFKSFIRNSRQYANYNNNVNFLLEKKSSIQWHKKLSEIRVESAIPTGVKKIIIKIIKSIIVSNLEGNLSYGNLNPNEKECTIAFIKYLINTTVSRESILTIIKYSKGIELDNSKTTNTFIEYINNNVQDNTLAKDRYTYDDICSLNRSINPEHKSVISNVIKYYNEATSEIHTDNELSKADYDLINEYVKYRELTIKYEHELAKNITDNNSASIERNYESLFVNYYNDITQNIANDQKLYTSICNVDSVPFPKANLSINVDYNTDSRETLDAILNLHMALKNERNNANHASNKSTRVSSDIITYLLGLYVKLCKNLFNNED